MGEECRDKPDNHHDERAPIPVLEVGQLLIELGVESIDFRIKSIDFLFELGVESIDFRIKSIDFLFELGVQSVNFLINLHIERTNFVAQDIGRPLLLTAHVVNLIIQSVNGL